MRTPVNALVMIFFLLELAAGLPFPPRGDGAEKSLLFLLQDALWIEVADAAALRTRRRIDHRIDQRGFAGIQGRVDRALEFIRACRIDPDAAERLHHPVVARALDEDGGCGVGSAGIDVGAAIDAVIVEDDDADRQLVTADRLDLHA